MNSRTTKQFWNLYNALPLEIQARADKAYVLWLRNPNSSGLRFKQVDKEGPIYSARINHQYRVLGILQGDTITWFWIGKHKIYDRLLR